MQSLFLFSPFYYPEQISTGKYNATLVQGLADAGWSIHVACSHPLYPSWRPTRSTDSPPDVVTHRGGANVRYPTQPILRRGVLELWFLFHAVVTSYKRRKEMDLVVSVFPPSLFMLGLNWLLPKDTPIIGIVHDLQGVYINRESRAIHHIIGWLIRRVERTAFRRCDHLIFLSETMRDICCREYNISSARSSVFYPFISVPMLTQHSRASLEHVLPSGRRTIVYSGALGDKQAPEELMQVMLAQLQQFADVHAVVFSEGPIFEALRARICHPRLVFHRLVEQEQLPELLDRSEIQIVPQAPYTSDGSLPSKLPNLIACGTKVLCITDPGSELGRLVSSYSKGAVSYSWDIKACLDATARLLALPPSELTNNDKSILDKFSLGKLVQHITEFGRSSCQAQ